MFKYEISKNTLMLKSLNENETEVFELDNNFIVEAPLMEVVNHSCSYFGSSYRGRVESSRFLLNSNYKLPIIVEETNLTVFIPTNSISNADCTWISLNHIQKYYSKDGRGVILFSNNKEEILKISYGSLSNQILRGNRLECIYRNNSEKLQKC